MLATCSVDKSVRVWNYHEKTLESETFFNEEAMSIGFHPSGFHLVVGFADKLRMLNVLKDKVIVYKEFTMKSVREIVFSNGGHLFAACSMHSIQVIPFYTGEINQNQLQFKGHSGKVKSIC